MRVAVKFFAIIRDRAGVDGVVLDIPSNSTVQIASARIAEEFPMLGQLLPRVAFAVNRSYVPITTELRDGDELAIIPPVSGG